MEHLSAYFGYFFQGSDQIVSFGAVFLLWFAFTQLGGIVGGRGRLPEIDHLVGWALVSFVFTMSGVFLRVPFIYPALLFAIVAVAAARALWRREQALVTTPYLKLIVLFAPLFLLISAMRGSQWDEFSTWLIIPRFLLESDAFPGHDNKIPNQALIACPYSWHYISYLTARLAGRLLENAGALFNVFLLLGFGLMIVRLIALGAGRSDLQERPPWSLLALGGLLATLLNPTFAQKVALTAYADVASAVTTAVAALLGWFMLEALIEGRRREAWRYALQIGAVSLVLVNLKQSTLVLFLLAVGAIYLVGLRERRVRLVDLIRLLPAIILPPLIVYISWRHYVGLEISGREVILRPYSDWAIDLLPQILLAMLTVLSKKGLYLVLFLVVAGFGLRGLLRSATPFDRLAAVVAGVVVGYNAFLLFAYVAAFSVPDALRAASYWRYNMHVGPLCVGFVAYGAALLWSRRGAGRFQLSRYSWIPIGLALVAPFVFAKKIRFDQAPRIVLYRGVAGDVADLVRDNDGVFVLDPKGSGESGVIVGYELLGRATYVGFMSAFHANKARVLGKTILNPRISLIIAHSMMPELADTLGLPLTDDRSYLLRRHGEKEWRIERTWNRP